MNMMLVERNRLLEAALLVLTRHTDTAAEMTDNHDNFGLSRQDMAAMLRNASAYRQATLAELEPLLARNQALLPYTDTDASISNVNDLHSIATCLAKIEPTANWGALEGEALTDLTRRLLGMLLSEDWDIALETLSEQALIDRIFDAKDFDAEKKLIIIRYCAGQREVVPQLYTFLSDVAEVMDRYFYIVQPEYDALAAQVTTTQRGALEALLPIEDSWPHQTVQVSITVLCFNSALIFADERRCDIYVGLHVLPLSRMHEAHAMHYVRDLKALADDTRIKMIRMMAKEPLYLQEIARRLELTPATVSHHLNILVGEGLVQLQVKDPGVRHALYITSASQLRKIANRLLRLADEVANDSVKETNSDGK